MVKLVHVNKEEEQTKLEANDILTLEMTAEQAMYIAAILGSSYDTKAKEIIKGNSYIYEGLRGGKDIKELSILKTESGNYNTKIYSELFYSIEEFLDSKK